MKYLTMFWLAMALLLTACGDDGETDAGDESPSTDTEAPTTTAATTTEPPTTSEAAPVATAVAVELAEFSVGAPATYDAGSLDFTITNSGDFNHEFNIVEGTYAELPQEPSGEVIEEGLDLLVAVEAIESGSTAMATVDLPPGNYVFFCNIAIGPNSHAGAGQTLDVTVS